MATPILIASFHGGLLRVSLLVNESTQRVESLRVENRTKEPFAVRLIDDAGAEDSETPRETPDDEKALGRSMRPHEHPSFGTVIGPAVERRG